MINPIARSVFHRRINIMSLPSWCATTRAIILPFLQNPKVSTGTRFILTIGTTTSLLLHGSELRDSFCYDLLHPTLLVKLPSVFTGFATEIQITFMHPIVTWEGSCTLTTSTKTRTRNGFPSGLLVCYETIMAAKMRTI